MKESTTRVLVVDDERFFREAISEALDAAGIESEKVSNGQLRSPFSAQGSSTSEHGHRVNSRCMQCRRGSKQDRRQH